MCEQVTLTDAIKAVKETVNNELLSYTKKHSKEVVVDSDECYRVVIDYENHLCGILVECPIYAPYRFVNIEVLSVASSLDTPIFFWCDSSGDSLDKIIEQVKHGIAVTFTNESA